MRKITILGLSCAALAASGWIATASAQAPAAAPSTDAPAPAPKPMKHHVMKTAKPAPKEAGDAAVEDLNAQSLDAAKAGKPFTPSSAPPAPNPPMAKKMPMKHHHMMMKKPAAPAPAPDAPK